MPSIADVYVTILPETSRVADGIRRALRSIDDDMYRSGRRWGDEIKRGMGDVGLDVDANTEPAKRKVRELDRDIDKKRVVKIEHDKTSFGALATATRNIEQNFQAIGIAALALPNTIANVSASLVQLSGLAGLLPATIGGAALAFGSLKVATLGFGDAMKNIRDVEKFNASVSQMAPNMQQLAGAIRTALPEIDRLKFTVQDAFGAGLGDQFTKLSSTYLPMFQTAMSQVAASANTALQTVGNMMNEPGMKLDMQGMLGNTTSAINILSQALAPVVKAFVDIGLVGSGFLPQLATAATQAATAFAVFIQNARATGDLQQWIRGGIEAMQTLGRIAGDIFNIFMSFAGMDTQGGGLLGMIESITSTVADFVNSPAGSGAIQTFITTLGTTVNALLPVLSSFLQTMSPILAGLGSFVAVVLQSLAPGLNAWLQAMQPVVAQLMSAFIPVLQTLQPVLTQVANTIAAQMVAGIQQILPLLGPLVQQFAQLVTALIPLLPSLMQLATSAIPAFQAALTLVLPLLTKMLEFLTQLANIAVPALSSQVGTLASSFTIQWRTISGAVSTAVNLILPLLERLAGKIEQILNGPIGKLLGALAGPVPRAIAAITGQPTQAATGAPGAPAPIALLGGRRHPGRKAGTAPQTSVMNTAPGGFPAAPIPGVSDYVAPVIPSGGGGGGGGGGKTPSAVSPTGTDWEKVAQGESGGRWDLNTQNGYYGGLQFDLQTWQDFGGTEFAERPDLASKEQQIQVAERVPVAQRPNRWPATYSAGAVGRPPAGTTPAAATSGYSGTAAAATAGSTGYAPAGADFDAALLAGVPAGRYQKPGDGGTWDLAQGLGDCSSAVEDLVNMLQGNPTAGRGMSTANAAEWLTAHGFQQGNMPGAFNVGFNSHHMQATLPGGTPFNWGSGEAAARGGVGGTGAEDPSFTDHYYMPVSGSSGGLPSGYPGTGDYSDYKSSREAQERVADAAQRVQDAQAELDKLRMTPGTTPEEIAKKERALAKAKREHADATNDLANAQTKYNDAAGKTTGGDFGKDLMGGIAEFFGFDGSLFKNPADFGLMKFLGGASKLKPAGGDGASLLPGGDGGGGGGGILSSVLGAFGALSPAASANAPGQFMPTMPSADSGGVVGRAFAPPGAAGPGNQPIDNSINIVNPVGQDHLTDTFNQAQAAQYPRMRQPLRNLPK